MPSRTRPDDDASERADLVVADHADDHDGGDGEEGDEAASQQRQQTPVPSAPGAGCFCGLRCWAPRGRCLLAVTGASALIGGLTFGYDLGVISDALLALRPQFGLTCAHQELLVSALPMGALAGSLLVSPLMDRWGRRGVLRANCALLAGASAALASAPALWLLLAGRLLLGAGVAVSASGECLYASEVAPPAHRGALVSANELGITLGLLLAYASGYLLLPAWRALFAMPALLALLQLACLQLLPPSPRYLFARGRHREAESVLRRIRGDTGGVSNELLGIERAVRAEAGRKTGDLVRAESSGGYRRRFLIGCGLVLLQQLSGQPCLLYYAPTVLLSVGFRTAREQTLATVGIGLVKVLSCLAAMACVDRVGRRRLLVAGSVAMATSLAAFSATAGGLAGSVGVCVEEASGNASSEAAAAFVVNATTLHQQPQPQSPGSYVALASLLTFVAAYSVSFGPVTWLVLSEIFPATLRARAIALCASLNWVAGLATSASFLSLLQWAGAPATFAVYCCVCICAIAFSAIMLPETSGKSLERIGRDFDRRGAGGGGGGGGCDGCHGAVTRLRRWLSSAVGRPLQRQQPHQQHQQQLVPMTTDSGDAAGGEALTTA